MQEFGDLEKQRYQYREDKDCTVKAQAACFNISYGRAHRQLAKAGREARNGASTTVMARAISYQTGEEYNKIIKEFWSAKYGRITIGRFCRENPKGTFIITSASHAMCVRDGVLIDWTQDGPQRRIVQNVYKVKEA